MTRILYIAGWGRSGTTILDNLLGQVPGLASTGELHNIWQRGLIEGRQCGCGEVLAECAWWQAAFKEGFGGIEKVDAADAVRAQGEIHTRDSRAVLRALRQGQMTERYRYAGYLKRLYDGIAASSGAEVIVDSSKFPADAIVAAGLPGYDVRIVHMVRDPRAVAHSWQRKRVVADKGSDKNAGQLRRVNLVRSTAVWQFYNQVIARHGRSAVGADNYLRVHYEELATEPERVVRRILQHAGVDEDLAPAFDGNEVEMLPTHTASGNPNRFRTGRTAIRLDDEWAENMPRWRRLAVTALAMPTLRQMSYDRRP